MSTPELGLLFLAVFVLALAGTALVRRLSTSLGLVAAPRADRWHRRPTALHGGAGFVPAFILGVLWISYRRFAGGDLAAHWAALPREAVLVAGLLAGSLLLFGIGLWDDLRQVRPTTKLLFQVFAASSFILLGGIFPLSGSQVINILVTYFWFVGITNAVNMLDNMDGLAAGVVALAVLTLVVLASAGQNGDSAPVAVAIGAVFLAMLLGFLVFNFPPASIFMGDSGSLFIGSVLAMLAIPSELNGFLAISTKTLLGPILVLAIPATVLAVPIFDTTLVTITRKLRAQKASQGGRDHSSHRLAGLGLPEWKTVLVLYGLAGFGGLVAVLLQRRPNQTLPLVLLFAVSLVAAGTYLGRLKVSVVEPGREPPAWTPLISELFSKRRFAEASLDVVLIAIAFHAAYLLRFGGVLEIATQEALVTSLPVVVPICLASFFVAGIYRGRWHLLSVPDIPPYALGAGAGAALSLAGVTLITRFPAGHSRGTYIIFSGLLFLLVIGSRLSVRTLDSLVARHRRSLGGDGEIAILVYGGGRAGKLLYEEISSHPRLARYRASGFVDDDPMLEGRSLCGLPVEPVDYWLQPERPSAQELWISTDQVSDQTASEVAARFDPPLRVRRLRLQLESVATPIDADEPAPRVAAISGAANLSSVPVVTKGSPRRS